MSTLQRTILTTEIATPICSAGSAAPAITSVAQIFELCALPNVIGLKFTDLDFYMLSIICNAGYVSFNTADEESGLRKALLASPFAHLAG